ncbi:hypothetical protein ABEF95_012004 [Exophiala dermatitidis]
MVQMAERQPNLQNANGPSSIDAMLRGLTERPNVQSTLILSRKDGSIIRATGVVARNTTGTTSSRPTSSTGAPAAPPNTSTPPQSYPMSRDTQEGKGSTATPQDGSAGAGAAAPPPSNPTVTKEQGQGQEDTTQILLDPEPEPEPLEVLASSIFQFVGHADSLGLTLGSISRGASDTGAGGHGHGHGYGSAITGSTGRTNDQRPFSSSDIKQHPRRTVADDEESDTTTTRGTEDEVQLLRLRTKHQEIIIFPDPNYICCVVQKMGNKAGGSGIATTHR